MPKTDRIITDPEDKRVINKTQLYIDKATERGIIHRDYLAHCLRWTHICKWVSKLRRKDDFSVLDIGCGDFPFLRTLYTNKMKPRYYLGVDVRDMNGHQGVEPNFEHEFQIVDLIDSVPMCKYDNWDLITFLEVIEHVSKENGIKILSNIRDVMASDTYLFLSTPCFNGKAAANHVYEWEYEELKNQLELMFDVEDHYGTFASQREIEPYMDEHCLNVYERLKDYYDCNYLSTIFAPLYPNGSRNCIWRLRLKK